MCLPVMLMLDGVVGLACSIAQNSALRRVSFMIIFYGDDKLRECAKRNEIAGQGLFMDLNTSDYDAACNCLTQVWP
jgi:hypothetical protein